MEDYKMKKTYIYPELELIDVKMQRQLLAVSGDGPEISSGEFDPEGGDEVESPGFGLGDILPF